MSEIIIDHEAAKAYALQATPDKDNPFGIVCRAYLDMVAQRNYWRTLYMGGVGELPLENNAHAQGEMA